MTNASVGELVEAVRRELAQRVPGAPGSVVVEPILNWGGFVNRSFRISTESGPYHLKLTADPHDRDRLRRWRTVRHRLETRYLAPRMVDWVEVAGTAFSGPLFEWIEGDVPERVTPDLVRVLAFRITALHGDRVLYEVLRGEGERVGTCATAYRRSIHERFVEDLAGIRPQPPPFVSPEHLDWMEREVRALEERVAQSAAFDEPADRPIHGDLWLNNVLVGAPGPVSGRVALLDWDGLDLGDPVLDWATFLGPHRRDLDPATRRRAWLAERLAPAQRERLSVWARATSLDWVIDPLADWVEAEDETPTHRAVVREANAALFERALAHYQTCWGSR